MKLVECFFLNPRKKTVQEIFRDILEITIEQISTRIAGRISSWTFGESPDCTPSGILGGTLDCLVKTIV